MAGIKPNVEQGKKQAAGYIGSDGKTIYESSILSSLSPFPLY